MSYSPAPMGTLSEWLKIMLDEVERKQDDAARAAAELQQRAAHPAPEHPPGTSP
ncbi:MAG: hypothetical protein ABI616_11470 [Pseudomonadota bacterium]